MLVSSPACHFWQHSHLRPALKSGKASRSWSKRCSQPSSKQKRTPKPLKLPIRRAPRRFWDAKYRHCFYQHVVDETYERCTVNARDCCARSPTTSVGIISRVRCRFDPFVQHRGCLLLKRAGQRSRSLLLDFCAMRYIIFRRVRASVLLQLLAFATCRAAAGDTPEGADPLASINISTRASANRLEPRDQQAMLATTPESTSSATGVSPLRPRTQAVAHPSHLEPATCRPTEPSLGAERNAESTMVEGQQKRWQGEAKDSPSGECKRVRC